jgi:hypothetical protein
MFLYCLLRGGMTMMDIGILRVCNVFVDALCSKAVLFAGS